jgi:peptidoglycan/LPS O-acetylase OafA/YrhL
VEGRDRLGYVDGLRAIAVLGVLACHSFPETPRFATAIGVGARGVDLFFVISGFCLAYPFLAARRRAGALHLDAAAYCAFLLRRATRIAPPYYAALALFALLALTPFGFPDARAQVTDAHAASNELLRDLFFFTSKSPIFNGSFWTLGIEARWYLLCPLLIALYARSRPLFFAAGAALYGLYFFAPQSIADEGTLPCFMAGICAADLALQRHALCARAWIGAAVFLPAALLCESRGWMLDHANPLWHAAGFFVVLAAGTPQAARLLAWRPLAVTGIASYSIYLVHGPFVAWFAEHGVPLPAAAGAALALGFVFWWLVERPLGAPAYRRMLEQRLRAPFEALRPRRLSAPRIPR